jgi:hypothetical protein
LVDITDVSEECAALIFRVEMIIFTQKAIISGEDAEESDDRN